MQPRTHTYGQAHCEICEAQFWKRHSEARFCSLACKGLAGRQRVAKNCPHCGMGIEVHRYKSDKPVYCSRECMKEHFVVPVTDDLIRSRFFESCTPGAPDECWNWKGPMGPGGYGRVSIGNTYRQASSRVSYVIYKGPIPDLPGYHGAVVRHRCDNRLCVNPAHLEIGTQADNVADQIERGKMPWSHR